ncbi:MAG: response regulator [Thermodesulfobacteriota bacterium]|nr:response regulator [Thermodesulfobacteriota bacterium]
MREKILIIERDRDIRKILETLLKKEQYYVRSVSAGDEALDILKSDQYGLIIMDINMPGTNGIQIMRNIKELDKYIEVIICTGLNSIDNAVQTLRAGGAFDFFSKPLKNEDQLIISVKQALEKFRLNIENNGFLRKMRNHRPAGKKILIVDDDPTIQKLFTSILSTRNYETEVASDGFEAGLKVMEFRPDIIILDLFMPGMDGFEVCKRIKGNPTTSQIKILAITGYDTGENRARIMEAGADDYLAKPIAMDTLLQHIEGILNPGEKIEENVL